MRRERKCAELTVTRESATITYIWQTQRQSGSCKVLLWEMGKASEWRLLAQGEWINRSGGTYIVGLGGCLNFSRRIGEKGHNGMLPVVDPALTNLADGYRSGGFAFWALYVGQSSIVIHGLAIVCCLWASVLLFSCLWEID